MLPKELRTIFNEYSEDDYSLSVIRAYCGVEFQLDFLLHVQDVNNNGESTQTWRIETVGYRQSKVSFGPADFLTITGDSPLLWEFTGTQGELYFAGKIKDPARLFVDLYKTHKKLFGGYQQLDLTFSEAALCSDNIPYNSGQIAKGPKKLLEQFAVCLKQNGVKPSIVGEWQPTVWDGFKYVADSKTLSVLFLGDTYIIAEKILFKKQDENTQ